MRGEVVHYDEAQGFGFLQGADGNSYSFRREDLRRDMPMPKGTAVEFKVNGTVDVPLPGLMKMIVVPVVSSEFEGLVEKYIDNLIKKFGGEV